MIVQHRLQIAATCPVDESVLDIYEVTVTVERTLPVEKILEATAHVTLAPIFQEDLTQQLAYLLDARVRTSGRHSGVLTTCEATPE